MRKNIYVKANIPHELIFNILKKQNKKNIIFYIDLQSVCKGLYNKNNIFFEINYYIENKEPSNTLIEEYRNYLNNFYKIFRAYNPKFITFYDDGYNSQNLSIQSSYKQGRSGLADILDKDEDLLIFREIKKRYFSIIEEKFKSKNVGTVYYLKQYESDLIPFYIISNNFYGSNEHDTLNIIISNDKDLLQCCQFRNTIQFTNRYLSSQVGDKRLKIDCWDDSNAIQYIYDKYKKGSLTSKFIPLILALAGDKADGINGIKGIGPKKAIDLILNYNIPLDPLCIKNELSTMPNIIKENIDLINQNLKMISFEEQIKRINIDPKEI